MKAHAPTVDKDIVNADSTEGDNTDGKGTAVHVGDHVTFKLTSEVPDTTGYSSYTFILEDTLSHGLTLDLNTQGGVDFNVTVSWAVSGETLATSSNVTLKKVDSLNELTGDSYFLESGNKKIYISLNVMKEGYEAGDAITITYTATLNESALSTDKETNTVKLTYSNNPTNSTSTETTPEKKVYVYDFDIVIDKYTGNKTGGTRLSGAEFVLLNADKDKYYQGVWSYTYTSGDDTVTVYSADGKTFYNTKELSETVTIPENTTPTKGTVVKVNWVDSVDNATHVTTDSTGAASFQGLDSGSYHLRETVAPDGYNLLKEDQAVTITATYAADGTLSDSSAKSEPSSQYKQTQPVLNNTGAELPDTGGMGTTLFYIAGGILVLGTVVLLVTRKRMENEAE